MKRFWTDVGTAADADGWTVTLDGRPLRTPGRALLRLPTAALADAIAAEWAGVETDVRPADQPMTGLASAAIDIAAADRQNFADSLAQYAGSDLTCYRADSPAPLVARQAAAWEPALKQMEQRHGLLFRRTSGVMPVPQPEATLEKARTLFRALDPFQLAPLQPLVTIAGSAVLALALLDGMLDAEAAFAAAIIDDLWQEEQWGADTEAAKARDSRRQQFLAAAHFLALATPSAKMRVGNG